jgi:sugar phosphate isomerase/epimerase
LILGISLPIGFLAGVPHSREDNLFVSNFHDPESCLEILKEHNVYSVEIRSILANTGIKTAILAVERVLKADMKGTIHGYLPSDVKGDQINENCLNLWRVFEIIKGNGNSSVITVHPYKSSNGSIGQVIDFNIYLVKNLIHTIEINEYPVKIALEINRAKGLIDPSYTYQNLLTIWEGVNNFSVGFCWDFGHSYWNVLKSDLEIQAPPEFVKLVLHTHVHDLSPSGETHWPLSENNLPLDNFVSQLISNKYSGVYNLELSAKRWSPNRSVKGEILKSIEKLQKSINV